MFFHRYTDIKKNDLIAAILTAGITASIKTVNDSTISNAISHFRQILQPLNPFFTFTPSFCPNWATD